MCVLAGCDFLPSIHGIGTKRAYNLVSKYKNLDRVLSVLKLDKQHQMPEDYSECFRKAVAVFHHARIYDAKTKALKPLEPLEQKHLQFLKGELDLLGPELPSSVAAAIAEGHLNPVTMEAFDHLTADTSFDTSSIPALDHVDRDEFQQPFEHEPQTISTQESCITIFSAHQTSNGKATDKIIFDEKKYMKEASALGKLIVPSECRQVLKHEVDRREVPNNNPFKKRKLEIDRIEVPDISPIKKGKQEDCSSDETECWTEQISVLSTVETAADVLYSSPESQHSVKSKPNKKESVGESNNQKSKLKIDQKSVKSMKGSIFNFFQRL